MKHNVQVTAILLLFFLLSQIVGLTLISLNSQQEIITENGETKLEVHYEETALGERPEFSKDYGAVIYLLVGVFIGTALILVLRKIKLGGKIWKYWYALAVAMTITVALGVFLNSTIALLLGILLAYWKIHKHNFWLHNSTEVLMYSGLAIILAPLFTVPWASVLLVIISFYDMYAVWQSKHMIALAKFTMKQNLFAGIYLQYTEKNKKTKLVKNKTLKTHHKAPKTLPKPKKQATIRQAILGGGDIVFPLIFAGTVFTQLLIQGYATPIAFFSGLIISVTTLIALYLLFILGDKNKFYPAMPFISIGCFIGYFIVQLLLYLF